MPTKRIHTIRASRWRAIAAAMLVAISASLARGENWPMAARDLERSNVTSESLPLPLAQAWMYKLAQAPRPAWPEPEKNLNRLDFDYAPVPVITNGVVYVGSSADDTLRAIGLKTGELRWRFTARGPIRFAPQVADGLVYFAADDGWVYCLDAKTGAPVWTFRAAPGDEMSLGNARMISRWPCRSGVLIDAGVLYTIAGMWPSEGVFVYALDAASGKVIWCNDTSNAIGTRVVGHEIAESLTGLTPQGQLLATPERLVAPMGRGAPATFDRKTGKLLAFSPGSSNGVGGSLATIDGNRVFVYGKSFYSPLNIAALDVESLVASKAPMKPYQMPVNGIPQPGVFLNAGGGYSHYESKTIFIVKDGRLTARDAYSIARAGTTLLLGYDNAVAAEDAAAKTAASVRFAVTRNLLMMHTRVSDAKVIRDTVKPWKGSCFEIFATRPGDKKITQLMFVPGVDKEPAVALSPAEGAAVAAKGVSVESVATPDGYELRALIALDALGIDAKDDGLDLELQITATSANGKTNRDTLFGSPLAYQSREKFGTFKFGKGENAQRTIPRIDGAPLLDDISTGLALLPDLKVRVTDNSEFWRADVDGKVYAMAISDGRLVASTDTGRIYCFAQASEQKKQPTIVDLASSEFGDTPPSADAAAILKRIADAGMSAGYAMIVGDAEGLLAKRIVSKSSLGVIVVVRDEPSAVKLRDRLLNTTRWYGSRIHVLAVENAGALPFPRWFASVVIVDADAPGLSGAELYRVLRPAGGVLMISPASMSADRVADLLKASGAPANERSVANNMCVITRGRVPGAWDWDAPRNEGDRVVRWPLRPLWFGGTAPSKTHNRKNMNYAIASANGRMIENGDTFITSVDAYNGAEWWSVPKPLEYHGSHNQSSISADNENVYFSFNKAVFDGKGRGAFVLDARTGEQKAVYAPWTTHEVIVIKPDDHAWRQWPLAVDKGFGASSGADAGKNDHAGATKKSGKEEHPSEGDAVGKVAMTTENGELLIELMPSRATTREREWQVCLDTRPLDRRWGLFERGVWCYRISQPRASQGGNPTWRPGHGIDHPRIAIERLPVERAPEGVVVRVKISDLLSDHKLAALPSFGFAAAYEETVPNQLRPPVRASLFCDEYADGLNRGWANVAIGNPDKSALEMLARRPLIIKGVIEEADDDDAKMEDDGKGTATSPGILPRAKLKRSLPNLMPGVAGATREQPFTGQLVEKWWTRGDGCAGPQYAAGAILSRTASIGIYDFIDDSGLRTFTGIRASCAGNYIAAQGVWYTNNGGSGCECTYAYLSQVALGPADRRLNEDWAVFNEWKVDTIVRRASINLGAPGDRRDEKGTLWLALPRPAMGYDGGTVGLGGAWTPVHGVWQNRKLGEDDPMIPLALQLFDGGGTNRVNADRTTIAGTDRPWLYASQVEGVREAKLKLDFLRPIAAARAQGAINADGKLDDAAWKAQPSAKLVTTGSNMWFAYDDNALYVACRWPEAIDRQGKARPFRAAPAGEAFGVMKDHWEVFVSDAKDRAVLNVAVNTNNARHVALAKENDGERAMKLDVNTGAAIGEDGFTAEFVIPFETLAKAGIDKETLMVNARCGDHPNVGEAMVRLGARSRERCGGFVPLGLGVMPKTPDRKYTLTLHFAELEAVGGVRGARPGGRVFDVKVQGEREIRALDIAAEAGVNKALAKTIKGVVAGDLLVIEFVPQRGVGRLPVLNALELSEEREAAK